MLHEHVVERRLDQETFITVRDFQIVQLAVAAANDVNIISITNARSSNGNIVCFPIGDTIETKWKVSESTKMMS